MEHQGKAKMKFDGKTPAKKFEMSFAPKTGTPMDLIWNMDFSSGFKYDYDFKMNAVTMEKGNGEYKWVNNGQKFEMSFAPKTGTPMDLIWNMDFSSGFKYDYDFKINAVTMEKGNGEYKWVNNGQKFELM